MRRDLPSQHHGVAVAIAPAQVAVLRVATGAAAPAGDSPLQVCHGQPLAGCCRCLQGPWLQSAAPAGRLLAVASHPLAGGLGCSRLPLAASHDQPLLLVVLTVNTLNDST
ncbi:hypothetical protein B296_00040603 [Ensete ventricosum]|uniref:Uncharacterized protein n=1 Tax=Ensete ventricosum TaxID=4639 RepID=A0A426X6L5_ENSVE|nr:hypothetical protein B296_00040603 [Ensete ventricosum]